MRAKSLMIVPVLAAAAVALTGCVANNPGGGESAGAAGGSLSVKSTADACTVSANTAVAGTLTFEVTNSGDRVTEFYLLGDDGLRIVGEVENIAPGASRTLTATVQPGSYFTECKPGMIGAGVDRQPFTVTGDRVELDGDTAQQQQLAVDNYKAYVRDQVSQLVPAVNDFVAAYVAGDDEKARDLFAEARVPYERIEPTAEAFGDLDPKIDYREVDAREEGLDWTGFHRIEKDLWPPAAGTKNSDDTDAMEGWTASTPDERKTIGDQLIADVAQLNDLVTSDSFEISLGDIANGAIGLLDEVATGKITGEEDWWSHTDLSDFKANVEGAEVAFGIVRDMALEKDAALVDKIDAGFKDLNTELAQFGDYDKGFTNYDELTEAQVKGLSDKVSALAEPLSQLTSTLLG